MNFAEIIAVIAVTLISLWMTKVIHIKLHLHKIRRAHQSNIRQHQNLSHQTTNAATNPHQLLNSIQQIPQ